MVGSVADASLQSARIARGASGSSVFRVRPGSCPFSRAARPAKFCHCRPTSRVLRESAERWLFDGQFRRFLLFQEPHVAAKFRIQPCPDRQFFSDLEAPKKKVGIQLFDPSPGGVCFAVTYRHGKGAMIALRRQWTSPLARTPSRPSVCLLRTPPALLWLGAPDPYWPHQSIWPCL